MTENTRKIDIALIYKTKDDNGNLLTTTLPDGTIVPDPLIITRNFNQPQDVEIRFSMWNLDDETLKVRLQPQQDEGAFDNFFQIQHDRMQEMARNGQVNSMIREHMDQSRIASLQAQVAKKAVND